jgi:hypothetical protein
MADSFRSTKRRLGRVKAHIDTLRKEIDRTFTPDLFKQEWVERWVGISKLNVLVARQTRNIPDDISDTAVEALDGLRSALDRRPRLQCGHSGAEA